MERLAVSESQKASKHYNGCISRHSFLPSLPPLRLTGPLWLYLGYLLMGTLYPFELEAGPTSARLPEFTQSLERGPSIFLTADFWSNILLFIPFGIIVSLHLPDRWRRSLWPVAAGALAACVLSSFIEFAQLFVRNRHSSITDVMSNTIGGLAGCLVVRFWPRSSGRHLASLIRLKGTWYSVLGISLVLACLPAALPLIVPNWHLPAMWATDVTVNAGNNPSLTHPWYGIFQRVAIYARAVDPSSAVKCVSPAADDRLLAFYEFDGSKSTVLLDRTGRGANLHLEGRGRFRLRPNHGGLLLRHPARLSTSLVRGKEISASLSKSREFSLEAWITPRNLIQRGPAPILSVAGLGDNTNLLLGQSTRDLVFWVRTPVSGPSVTALSVTSTNHPLSLEPTHLVAVFREGRLELFVNGVRSGSLDLRRDAMIGLPARRTHGARVAYAFFYFFPFTLLWSSLLARRRARSPRSSFPGPWLPWFGAVIFLLIGEMVQARWAGRSFDWAFLLVGTVVISTAAVVARLSSPVPQSE